LFVCGLGCGWGGWGGGGWGELCTCGRGCMRGFVCVCV